MQTFPSILVYIAVNDIQTFADSLLENVNLTDRFIYLEATAMPIATARQLVRFAATKAFGGQKVAVVSGIDKLNPATANTLLKIIEEPPENFTIYLLSETHKVLSTIKSRCVEKEYSSGNNEIMNLAEEIRRKKDINLSIKWLRRFPLVHSLTNVATLNKAIDNH